MKFNDYLKLAENYFMYEQSFLPLMSLTGNLMDLYWYAPEHRKYAVADLLKIIAEETFIRLCANDTDAQETNILRNRMLYCGVFGGSVTLSDYTLNVYKIFLKGEKINSNIRPSILKAAAYCGNDFATLRELTGMYAEMASEEERRDVLIALGSFHDPKIVKNVWDFAMKNVPISNQFVPISAMAANPKNNSKIFELFQKDIDAIKEMPSMSQQRIILALCGNWREIDSAPVINLLAGYSENPEILDSIQYGLEIVQINHQVCGSIR